MKRGLLLSVASLLIVPLLQAADPEKIPFKQTGNGPRDLPVQGKTAPETASDEIIVIESPSAKTVAFQNYKETLKAWRSAKKRLYALQVAEQTLQSDPAADKKAVAMISLMAIEKTREVESLRSQLAMLLVIAKLDDPDLPSLEREEIGKSVW